MKRIDYTQLPSHLPEPVDDGAAMHLLGMRFPAIALPSTSGVTVNPSTFRGRTVIYCYPLTGRPDRDSIPAGWDEIPGARGCTLEACAFRDHYAELQSLGASVYGLSTQTTDYQLEARNRLHLPFELLSDAALELTQALNLPTFAAKEQIYLKRLTLILSNDQIEKVFYPIFPPHQHADDVIAWLQKCIAGVGGSDRW